MYIYWKKSNIDRRLNHVTTTLLINFHCVPTFFLVSTYFLTFQKFPYRCVVLRLLINFQIKILML